MRFSVLLLLVSLFLGVAACASEPETLTVGLLSPIDGLPFYVAEQEGYFTEAEVEVALVPFSTVQEVEAALASKEIDVAVWDMIGVLVANTGPERRSIAPTLHIVKISSRGFEGSPKIAIVAGPDSGIQSPEDLAGKRVGLAQDTLIDYVTDRVLDMAEVDREAIERVDVPDSARRLEMLSTGQLDAATFATPMISLAVQQGGQVILEDNDGGTPGEASVSMGTISFRDEMITSSAQRAKAKRFLAAHEKAVKAINANPTQFRALLAEKGNLPAALTTTFEVPRFPENELPTQTDVRQISSWLLTKEIILVGLGFPHTVDPTHVELVRK